MSRKLHSLDDHLGLYFESLSTMHIMSMTPCLLSPFLTNARSTTRPTITVPSALIDVNDAPTKQLKVTLKVYLSLQWWNSHTHLARGRLFVHLDPSIQITTDARTTGWCAHCKGLHINGTSDKNTRHLHINILELLAIFNALKSFELMMKNQSVQIITDNTTALYYLNKQDRVMVLCQEHLPHSHSHLLRGQFNGRPTQQETLQQPQVVPIPLGIPNLMPSVGQSHHRLICLMNQSQISSRLLQSRPRLLIPSTCICPSVKWIMDVRISSSAITSEKRCESPTRSHPRYSGHTSTGFSRSSRYRLTTSNFHKHQLSSH
ncbi:hypothetical protein JRQ81_005789, partial [Phrynocephalus forsythii]